MTTKTKKPDVDAKKRSDAAKKAAKTRAENAEAPPVQADAPVPSQDAPQVGRVVDSPNGDLPTGVSVKTDDGTFTPEKDPNWDGWALLNGFVSVTGGDHAGKYGFTNGTDGDGKVIVVTRDDNHERIVVDYSDLARDRAGRR